jgi:lysyl endopeptidase
LQKTLTEMDCKINIRDFSWSGGGNIVMSVLVLMAYTVMAQSDLPIHYDKKLYNNIATTVDLSKDSLLATAERANTKYSKDFAGYLFQTDFTTHNAGEWKHFSNEYDTWIFKVKIENVAGIALVLSHVKLSEGATLFIYNTLGIKGPYRKNDIAPSGILLMEYLPGDELIIELNIPVGSQMNDLVIKEISFTDNTQILPQFSKPENKRSESCYRCLTGDFWSDIKQSVVRIIAFHDGEALMCTGALINNTAQDAKPYILTAQHCIATQEDADRSIFLFNDEILNCNDGVVLQRSAMSGAVLRSTSYENDFTLLELYEHVPLGSHPYFAGWDITDTEIDHVSCIHHPLGDGKRISLCHQNVEVSSFDEDTKTRSENAFWHVPQWDEGITEGGSSGAPLFNGQQRIIGSLTGGQSSCGYPYHDYFARLSKGWNYFSDEVRQLQHWLDPISSHAKKIDGFDPFPNINVSCDTLLNITSGEGTTVMPYPKGEGFLSGCNSDGIADYAEAFKSEEGNLTGVQFYVGSVNIDAVGGVNIFVMNEKNSLPGDVIAQVYVPYSKLHLYFNYVEFYPYVHVSGNFFIAYSLTCSMDNTFALELAAWRLVASNTAYIKRLDEWHPLTNMSETWKGTSLYIQPILCKPKLKAGVKVEMVLYPNPASAQIIINLPTNEDKILNVQLLTIDGRISNANYHAYANSIVIDVAALMSAPYLLRVSTNKKAYTGRFVKL